jgi:hypothetical protein
MSTLTNKRITAFRVGGGPIWLYVMDCYTCGVVFAITIEYEDRRRDDGRSFQCPNGHGNAWSESEADRQRRRAEIAERNLRYAHSARDAARDQAAAAERSAAAYRGHLTRLRNKVANGICPVNNCRRTFTNVLAHISTEHPQWVHEHPEALL